MGLEIERRFLVVDESWQGLAPGRFICQGYLSVDPERVVRIRIVEESAFLTIKGKGDGVARPEFEYPLSLDDGRELLALCGGLLVEKMRYRIEFGGFVWDLDVFSGANSGLVMAEIELEQADQEFPRPPWVGLEVTADHCYCNVNLALHPWSSWIAKG
ncbi:MAG: CYTH domain-containing protein [Desulfobulbaceae bacterium]|uniref:CYTH domain-containing protein n=1 Tax=Candidatus Desulfatifera sulfidica TaxID=2841691 RepID=A0A8J6NAI2_9BACT|nr:CYTH domain-containing protein [Candidatus Desulfatifera sulfidica]